MQYTLSLTARMMVLVAFCLAMLALLLFLAGIEIGKRMGPVAAAAAIAAPLTPAMAAPPLPAASAGSAPTATK
jgi:hypothetical protein